MAIYHCSIKIFSRGKGESAIAKAAYRAAEAIKSEHDGNTYDYTRKRGIVHKEVLLPKHAPAEYADRKILWNAVEKTERNCNAQLAREIEVSLPVELTQEQNIDLIQEYIKRNFVEQGMCADICVHDTGNGNPHAHIMLTLRPFEKDGSWGAKSKKEYILDNNGERVKIKNDTFKTRKICTVDWNEPAKMEEWRSSWADAVNAALENAGIPEIAQTASRPCKKQKSVLYC
jgi:ATP-dependent exoDNAse (exonuclease V) alpha subunit